MSHTRKRRETYLRPAGIKVPYKREQEKEMLHKLEAEWLDDLDEIAVEAWLAESNSDWED